MGMEKSVVPESAGQGDQQDVVNQEKELPSSRMRAQKISPSKHKAPALPKVPVGKVAKSNGQDPASPPAPAAASQQDVTTNDEEFEHNAAESDGTLEQGSAHKVQKKSPSAGKPRAIRNQSLRNGKRSNLAPDSGATAEPPKPPGSPGRGYYLLKLAKTGHISGDNPNKTLDYATRASDIFRAFSDSGKPSLELIMSLHIVAAAYCRMGKYTEAVEALKRTLEDIPIELVSEAGLEYSLAAFAGYMQLGDTYAKLGKQSNAVASYGEALRFQKQALGDMDPQVGETCRYLSEAYLQAMRFDEAEELCAHVLKIHAERSAPGSVEEAVDRRLMALIQSGKGEHETALQHLVFASTAMSSHGQDLNVASIDASIGDCYVALGKFDEAVFSYQKALTSFKHLKGENHASVASMYVSLGELSLVTGKNKDAKTYSETALRNYGRQGAGHVPEELAAGLTDLAGIYEALNEREQALALLQKALEAIDKVPGEQRAAAGIQAQMGVFYYMLGKFSESQASFASAVAKLKSGGELKSPMLGILLNQMGLALFELSNVREAVEVLEEAQNVLVEACGVHHPDTVAVCSNLSAGYDALGRVTEAIDLLEKALQSQEERLGTAHPDVVDERMRLEQMLKDVGRPLVRKTSTLEELLLRPAGSNSRSLFHKLVR